MKVFDTLRVLVEHAGRLVTKQELLAGGVARHGGRGEQHQPHRVGAPQGARGEGDRPGVHRNRARVWAIASSRRWSVEAAPARAASVRRARPARQEIRYCTTSDGVRLAYARSGQGPPLVKASNWLTHLDFEWESPIWRHWWASSPRTTASIRYDERGNGMSQRDVADVSFETWVRDLETVVDAAALDRFTLLGISRGASIAIAYAVRHPERVSQLVLYGAFATGLNLTGSREELEAQACADAA